MGLEIERKYLVISDEWPRQSPGIYFKQGYLSREKQRVVRVRVAGSHGFLTVKGENTGLSRLEFEYEIPLKDAEEMLDQLCPKPLIEKTRYSIEIEGLTWEIDEFLGENQGLVIAEVELVTPEERIIKPDWVGEEVTGDTRYYNSNLYQHPYHRWAP